MNTYYDTETGTRITIQEAITVPGTIITLDMLTGVTPLNTEEIEYTSLLDELGLCDCGNPEETIEWVRDGLRLIAEKCPEYQSHEPPCLFFNELNQLVIKTSVELTRDWNREKKKRQVKHFGSDAGFQFFANWANTGGYAEHGSNIINSWLTREGEKLMERIEKVLQ